MARKKQTTKTRIVKAAWNLFYKQGYETTTIDEIIELSKTSKGSFYHYFKGKDSLLSSLSYLFDDSYDELMTTLDPSMNSYDKLILMNRHLFEMIETTVDINLLAFLYSSQLVTKEQTHLLDQSRSYYIYLNETIIEGQERGEISTKTSAQDISKLYALMERAALYDWCLCKGNYSLSEYGAYLLKLAIEQFKI